MPQRVLYAAEQTTCNVQIEQWDIGGLVQCVFAFKGLEQGGEKRMRGVSGISLSAKRGDDWHRIVVKLLPMKCMSHIDRPRHQRLESQLSS